MKYNISKQKLIDLYHNKKLTYQQISTSLNIPKATLCRIFKKYNIKARKYPSWNKGKTCFDDSRILSGSKHPKWKNKSLYLIDYKLKKRTMLKNKTKCNNCDKLALLLHHKDLNPKNNESKNLMPLCASCHTILHNKRRGITIYKHNCEECGNEFTIKHNRKCKQRFCSLSCKSKHLYRSGRFFPQNPR